MQVEYEIRKGKPFVDHHCRQGLAGGRCGRWFFPDGGAFLGSTNERILRKALVPVMVSKKPLSVEAKTFLVPTDFSPCARKAAEEASCWRRVFLAGWFSFMFWT